MYSNPDISVVMSVYNGDLYLAEAIESILNQTFKNFELIIINDGSTDKSLEIIKNYTEKDDRIVLIDRENKGLIASLNEGVGVARGKYIARMDADDISLSNRFDVQYRAMEADEDLIVCGSWIEQFYGDEKKILKLLTSDTDIKTMLLFGNPIAHPAVFIRKSILIENNIRYDKEFLHAEDYRLWVELTKYGKFKNISQVLLKYRYLENSVTRIADLQPVRRHIIAGIYKKAFENKKIYFDYEELYLLFDLFFTGWLKSSLLSPRELNDFVGRLLGVLSKAVYVNYKLSFKTLTKRYVWYFFVKKDIRILAYKNFWCGAFYMLKDYFVKKFLLI